MTGLVPSFHWEAAARAAAAWLVAAWFVAVSKAAIATATAGATAKIRPTNLAYNLHRLA